MKNLVFTLAFATLTHIASAQESLPELVNNALKAMQEGQWEQALAFNVKAVADHGADPNAAATTHGAQFGTILFRKGICEMRLKKYQDALLSFESCYEDYPNDATAGGGNSFHKQALLKWGDAALSLGEYELAITQWKKFLEERDKATDKYQQGTFHVNMAFAHYRLGKIPQGNEHLEIAIQNKNSFPTPDEAIVVGFQELVKAAITAKDEASLLEFIEKNRGGITVPAFAMQKFSKVFMKMASEALAEKMFHAAINLYQFVPPSEVAIEDLRVQIRNLGNLPALTVGTTRLEKAKLEKQLADLESEFRGNKSVEMFKLSTMAYIHEMNENRVGAYSACLQLETFFPKSEKREDNLFNLVRNSSAIGKIDETQKYGQEFLKAYPDSTYKADVQKLMLSSLFFEGKYDVCIEIADDIIKSGKAVEGTPEHDLALFVLGGSYFYTGKYDQAAPLLDLHVEKYKESMFAMSSAYFQASNVSRLQFWSKAGKLLDAFLDKYKNDTNQAYIPLALLDRANAHYAEDEGDAALAKTDRILKEFPNSPVVDQAYNLRGNIYQGADQKDKAEESYLKALEVAETRGNDGVAGEAIYYLVALLGEHKPGSDFGPRLKEVIPFSEKYWKKYAMGSPYKTQLAVAQMYAMQSVGRSDEGLQRLQQVISEMAKQSEISGLELAINSYTDFYLEKYTPDQLKDHYYSFPGITTADKAARAILRIAVIGVFETIAKNKENPEKQRAAEAMITILFQNLKGDFQLKDLSNYILVKLGDYLRTNTSAPREALAYYDEALSRQDQAYRFAALLGRADVYGASSNDADLKKGLDDFERIFADSQDKSEREFSLFRIIEILMKRAEYEKVSERANQYLEKEEGKSLGFSKFSPQVGLILAQSFEKRKMTDDAIAMYVKVWSAHMGLIPVSAPAVEAWMNLSYNRNRKSDNPNVPSDRQGAYEGGHRFLELTGRFKDKMKPEEVVLWEKVQALTEKFKSDPNVKSMEQILKEKAEAAGQ